jgi:predicted regulator of Ras-like GTPase activity (Roadblock/LC7/MglB family)
VEPADVLADLTEISSQIESAVLFDATGAVSAATGADDAGAAALARAALDLFAASATLRAGGPRVTRMEVTLPEGTLIAVREGEGLIAATTTPEPPSALVVYDLRTALRRAAEAPKKKPARRRTKKGEDADVAP